MNECLGTSTCFTALGFATRPRFFLIFTFKFAAMFLISLPANMSVKSFFSGGEPSDDFMDSAMLIADCGSLLFVKLLKAFVIELYAVSVFRLLVCEGLSALDSLDFGGDIPIGGDYPTSVEDLASCLVVRDCFLLILI